MNYRVAYGCVFFLFFFYKNCVILIYFVVGTNVGDVDIWEVGSKERIAHKTFKVWDMGSCSMPLQVLSPLGLKVDIWSGFPSVCRVK